MSNNIHSTAIIGENVKLGEGVTINPYAVLEDNIVIGDNVSIGSHAYIGQNTSIGDGTTIFNGASVGTIPQDLKYKGEDTTLVIGKNCIIREFCTINRGTIENGSTIIGDDCALLAYCHVAHDCIIGNNVVISNSLSMAGHVKVGDNVVMGGGVGIHQFCKIGSYAMVGAKSVILKDVVPFSLCAKGEAGVERIVGINKVGLERHGFNEERRREIKRAFKTLFRQNLPIKEAILELKQELFSSDDVAFLVSFLESSERGLYNMGK